MSPITRRDLINGIVGTTTAAMLAGGLTVAAQPVQGEHKREHDALNGEAFKKFRHFIRLSAVLTGIDCAQLAPTFASDNPTAPDAVSKGSDPINADKLAYFELASGHPAYPNLLDAFDKAVQSVPVTDVAQLDQIAVQLLKKDGIS